MDRRFVALAFLAACLTGALALTACSSQSEQPANPSGNQTVKDQFAVASPVIPQKIKEDDPEAWLKTLEANPLDDEYLASLSTFSYKTAPAALGEVSETGAANSTYSPISLYFALSLATQGAAGPTATELNKLLEAANPAATPEQCGNLFRVLAGDPYSTVALANSIWLSGNEKFKQSFIDVATQQFYATPFSVEFGAPETDAAIAAWIKKNTNGTIDPKVNTSKDQLLSIINTVYFKDSWGTPFDAANTKDDTFYTAKGDVTAPFMTQRFSEPKDYVQTEKYTRASLSFAGSATMSFVLPAEGLTPEDILADKALLEKAFTSPETELAYITYSLPKTSFDTSFDLVKPLKSLGVTTAFSDAANFSNLSDTPAYISAVKQESYITWDENGAEASAYTNVSMNKMSIAPDVTKELVFKLDRPFLFEIRSNQNVPLFIGVCGNPVA